MAEQETVDILSKNLKEGEMKVYYDQRAKEYEKVYERPERQNELEAIKAYLKNYFRNKRVLEIACGTGYWTQVIAQTARFISATDQSQETLEVARSKSLDQAKAFFLQDDAYSLTSVQGEFTAGFAGFWWSHIPKSEIRPFLHNFHSKLSPNASIVFIDNEFKIGNSTPISRTDNEGNTYQIRALSDGSNHEILKNFPTDAELKNALNGIAENIEITRSQYYWLLEYKILNSI